jgi:hypothetical protein
MIVREQPLINWMNNFYGYGSWRARFWFIGLEETGADLPEDLAERINYFQQLGTMNHDLINMRELYRHVTFRAEGPRGSRYATLYEYRFEDTGVLHGAWKNLIAFVHGYDEKPLSDQFAYQRKSFVDPGIQREALISLYPLPTPHNHAWYYAWLNLPNLPFLKSRDQYRRHFYATRIETILRNIRTYSPEVVVMYGMENVNKIKESVLHVFPEAKFKLEKGTRLVIPQHHYTVVNGTKLIITTQVPALKHNRVETGFDWEGFGKRLKLS